MRALALTFIWFYRMAISGWLGSNCRFQPSCSHYAKNAFEIHPPTQAFILTLRRLSKCHPFGPFGFDPVPDYRGSLEKQR